MYSYDKSPSTLFGDKENIQKIFLKIFIFTYEHQQMCKCIKIDLERQKTNHECTEGGDIGEGEWRRGSLIFYFIC